MPASPDLEFSPEGSGEPPRALIVTVYGLYAREVGGWISIANLIDLMAELGADAQTVRSAVSRLKRRGMLEAERRETGAGYAVTAYGRSFMDAGDRRILERRPRAEESDGWVVAVFSVPESERQKRHTLRSRLAWLGYGTVTAGVWIAPVHLAEETQRMLSDTGLEQYVDIFSGDYLAFGDLSEKVASWWNLAELEQLYSGFVSQYAGPTLDAWRRRSKRDGYERAAFADYVRTLTAWRRLPYLDPGLPESVLPKRWSAAIATDMFFEVKQLLEKPAHEFMAATVAR